MSRFNPNRAVGTDPLIMELNQRKAFYRVEKPGSARNTDLLVLAPLNGSPVNLVDGVNGAVTGSLAYEPCFFHNGFRANLTERVTYSFNDFDGVKINEGAIFVRFKPFTDLNPALNIELDMVRLYNSASLNECIFVRLNYNSAQGYYGIEAQIRTATFQRILTFPNISFTKDTVHSIALTWKYNPADGKGIMSIYLDGQIVRANTFTVDQLPTGVNRFVVGNTGAAGNRPAKSILEDAVFYGKWLPTAGILKMHRFPTLPEAVVDKNIYNAKSVVLNYKRETINMAVKERDPGNGRLWGHTIAATNVLGYSDDNGMTFTSFFDFGAGTRIRGVYLYQNNLLVCVDDKLFRGATTGTPAFAQVLSFYPGLYAVNGWGFTSDSTAVYVSEYGQSTAAPQDDARLFKSTDGGVTWTVIKTLPTSADHIHAIKIDPYTGRLWLTYGDAIEAIEYSGDGGTTWTTIPFMAEQQSIDMVFTKDVILFEADSVGISGCLLNIYDKNTQQFSQLVDVPEKQQSNVYALHIDSNDVLWWFANYESRPAFNSGIWVSGDFGATAVLAEDLGANPLSEPHRFIENDKYLFLGNNRFAKPLVVIPQYR